jgi:hypothetical protein
MSERRSARVPPSEVHERLAEYLLTDGYRLVLDAEGSDGSWHQGVAPDGCVPRPVRLHDAANQHRPGQD